MSMDSEQSGSVFGFLAIEEIASGSFCGGLLLLDQLGRPLEFHCSLPVQPDGFQQILYGSTFKSFLYCDQIGSALIAKATRSISLLIVDDATLIDLQQSEPFPPFVLLQKVEPDAADKSADEPVDQAVTMSFGNQATKDSEHADTILNDFVHRAYLAEPFERIHEAIEQANKAA